MDYVKFLAEQKSINDSYNMGFITTNEFLHQQIALCCYNLPISDPDPDINIVDKGYLEIIKMALVMYYEPTEAINNVLKKVQHHLDR